MVKFKAIKQKREFDSSKVIKSIVAEAKRVGRGMNEDWRKPTADWEGVKPVIGYTLEIKLHILTLFSGVKGKGLGAKKMGWLNDGTRPHIIQAHNFQNPLTFQAEYSPKTFVGKLLSNSGGSYGAYVRTMEVYHPGIRARRFDEVITRDWEHLFITRMRAAYERGLQATGHGM